MTRIAGFATLALVASLAAPAYARDFVQDGAGMFSQRAIDQVDQRIATFNRATGKEIVVVTIPSLGGAALQDAATKAFSQQNVNGVLIFIARDDRRDIIVPDRSGTQAGWFTPDVLRSIRQQMEREFRNEAYDSGLLFGVDGVLQVYGAHMQGRAASGAALAPNGPNAPAAGPRLPSISGVHISMFWWIVIIVVGFLIVRSVMRAASAPRYGPPGPPGSMPPAGYGPGYGPGYGGYGGGGGSFWSGLLGGLGGAWLGNEMFGNRGGGAIAPADAAQNVAPDSGGGWGADSGGWQGDAGQADMGGASAGDWSGGGFGDSGGGDSGGGDFGGGGGDSGGGW